MIEPDAPTKERISNLARVGKALNDTYSEENLEVGTDFYLALDSLNKFKEGIVQLNLEEESMQGMLDLIEYLKLKIERRMGYMDEDINL
jgi:predicted DNA-binding protein